MKGWHLVLRELRVQSRARSLAWHRVILAGIGSLMAVLYLSAYETAGAGIEAGRLVFGALSGLAFALCLVEGIRHTFDSLSSERRGGTLPLLFLTELQARDVLAAKFTAAGLRSFHSLMLLFPAIAVALPAGGVSSGEVWRTQLVLLQTLFLALACGLHSSARSRDDSQSLLGSTLRLVLLLVIPALSTVVPWTQGWPSPSPLAAWIQSDPARYAAGSGAFWVSLLTSHLLSWVLLVQTSLRLQQDGRDSEIAPTGLRAPPAPRERTYSVPPALHGHSRRPLLDSNPVAWLERRCPGRASVFWLAMGIGMAGDVIRWILPRLFGPQSSLFVMLGPLTWIAQLSSMALISATAARPLMELRQSRAAESLLTTPLPTAQLAAGISNVQLHRFLVPLALLALWRTLSLGLSFGVFMGVRFPDGLAALLLLGAVVDLVSYVTAFWLGLRHGLTRDRLSGVMLQGVLWAGLIPDIAQTLLQVFIFGRLGSGGYSWSLSIPAASLVYHVVLILRSGAWFRTHLRDALTGSRPFREEAGHPRFA